MSELLVSIFSKESFDFIVIWSFCNFRDVMAFTWSKCIICQKVLKEDLRCPLKACGANYDPRSVYTLFLNNVSEFNSIDALPASISIPTDASVDVLIENKASWHKSCHLQFSTSKLKKTLERKARKTEKEQDNLEIEESRVSKRQRLSDFHNTQTCILCGQSGQLHDVTTFATDEKLCRMITELQDTTLLPKVSGVDLIAAEAKYHLKCMTDLRNRYRGHISGKRQESCEKEEEKESQAFIELTEYIENSVDNGKLLFLLSELHSMYVTRLENLGVHKTINKTRLKTSLLENFQEAQEQSDGKNVVIIFNKAIQSILKEAVQQRNFSEDAMILAKASAIVRKDMFSHEGFKFSGSFTEECQEQSVPASLKSLISMILNGVNIQSQESQESQACLTVCQTILFNAKERGTPSSKSGQTRHTKRREPPLPLYIGFNVHAMTRSRTLLAKLYQVGLSVSYQRIIELEDMLAISISERFEMDGIVAPACLRKGIFTIGALDNIDHNPSSTTATTSFHGTGISIFQLPTEGSTGEERPPVTLPPQGTSHSLPEEYATVHPVELNTSKVTVPECLMEEVGSCTDEEKQSEIRWVEHSLRKLQEENLTSEDTVTWASFHSSDAAEKDPPALTALLPLFYEKAATPAMIKHGMNVLKQAIQFLNPNQVPVITVDQPLFALVKMVQWKWPASHGEKKYVVMLGGLHIEMALWSLLGDMLDGSGWTAALVEANVASSGVADSFLKVTHLTRTR